MNRRLKLQILKNKRFPEAKVEQNFDGGNEVQTKVFPRPKFTSQIPITPTTTSSNSSFEAPERLKWFNDPFLLADFIKLKLDQLNCNYMDICNLVYRHLGAANPHVYNVLITSLLHNNQFSLAWASYEKMIKYKKEPISHTYTALLNNLSVQARSSSLTHHQLADLLKTGTEIWDQIIDDGNIRHLNAYLALCCSCASVGGWDIAWQLYLDISDKTLQFNPDLITYSILLRTCANNRNQDGYDACMQVWNDLISAYRSEARTTNPPSDRKPLRVDEQILVFVLLACIRAAKMDDARKALDIIHTWIGLPVSLDSTEIIYNKRRTVDYKRLSQQTIDALIRTSNRLKEFKLGMLWYDLIVKQTGIQCDQIIQKSLITLFYESGNFDDALKMMDSLYPKSSHTFDYDLCQRSDIWAAAITVHEMSGKYEGMSRNVYVEQAAQYVYPIISSKSGVLVKFDEISQVKCLRNLLYIFYKARKHLDWAFILVEMNLQGFLKQVVKKFQRKRIDLGHGRDGNKVIEYRLALKEDRAESIKIDGYKSDTEFVLYFETLVLALQTLELRKDPGFEALQKDMRGALEVIKNSVASAKLVEAIERPQPQRHEPTVADGFKVIRRN